MKDSENNTEDELENLLDDAEIKEELLQEEKLRKKKVKIMLISITGLLTIAVVYFGTNYYNILSEEEQFFRRAELPVLAQSAKEILPLQSKMKKIEDIETVPTLRSFIPAPAPDNSAEEKESKPPEPSIQKKVKKKPPPPPPGKTPSGKSIDADKILIAKINTTGKYYVQLGVFVVEENAKRLVRSLKNKGFSPSNAQIEITHHRVYAGGLLDKNRAKKEINNLKKVGITAILKAESNNLYTLQAGSFYSKKNAERVKKIITKLGLPSKIGKISLKMGGVHRVYVGKFKTKKEAVSLQQKLAKRGFSKTIIKKG